MEKTMSRIAEETTRLEQDWATNPRWEGTIRDYTAREVVELRGSIREEHTLARLMSEKLWNLITSDDYINALGAVSYTHLRAHETVLDLVCRLLLEKKKKK